MRLQDPCHIREEGMMVLWLLVLWLYRDSEGELVLLCVLFYLLPALQAVC